MTGKASRMRFKFSKVAALRTLGATAILWGLGIGMAGPAFAHDSLISSTPKDGAELDSAPKSIELNYSSELQPMSPVIRLTGEEGDVIVEKAPQIDGATATLTLPGLDPGSYAADWRVVSSDGHPIEGTLDFTVSAPAPSDSTKGDSEETGQPENAEQPEDTGQAEDTAQPETTTQSPTGAEAADEASSGGSSTPWLIASGVVLLVALGGGIVWVLRKG